MPPPAAVAELPEAQRPFSDAGQVHNLGHMDVACSGCGALHWMDEKLSSSSLTNPKFGMCCFSGKMDLPKLHDLPPELHELFTGTGDVAKKICKDICRYNNALAMTSVGCKTDNLVNWGAGPYVFKIHGRLTHRSGSLLPPPNGHLTYAQLYIYDLADALDYHMGHQANNTLHHETMQTLQDMLWCKHTDSKKSYKQRHTRVWLMLWQQTLMQQEMELGSGQFFLPHLLEVHAIWSKTARMLLPLTDTSMELIC